jgi:membrane-bound lytic murein transglycosylase D
MGLRRPVRLLGKHCSGETKPKVCLPAASVVLAGIAALGMIGCEDSARKPVAAYHPIPIPSPAKPNLDPLPLNASHWRAALLAPAPPNGVELLARQAEAALNAGEREFQLGDLSGARLEFAAGLGVLQESGFDVQSEPRLADLFGRLVETAHNDETIASRQASGNGQAGGSGSADELSGIDFSPEGIPQGPVDPRLRTSAEGEVQDVHHDLPLTVNDSVLAFLNFFSKTTKGRAVVETGLRRAGRYRPMIQRVLREQGLPSDLMYMAQAESAFQPQALSSAGARGLWQFMSFRGEEYGLEHSFWVDDRQDPEKATEAAAHHLRDLYGMFGDWYLAMAAYDSGPGAVQRAVERTGYADFWELYKRNALPKETRNYVPIILALTLIAKDPARYGIDVEPEEPLRTDTVQLDHAIDLRLVADSIDVDVDTLRSLNPQLLRLVTPATPKFTLHLPEGTADEFTASIGDIPPDKWLTWRRHQVLEGETLAGVAAKYHVSAAAIADTNGLDAHALLEAGDKLIIPVPAQPPSAAKLAHYRVRTGDTLEGVADEFDVSAAEVKQWNHLRTGKLARGMRLTIYLGGAVSPAAGPASSAERVPAKAPVKAARGESVATEASVAAKAETKTAARPASRPGTEAIVYRVQPGETLWSIAKAYKTTVEALRSGNQFLFSRPLEAGDTLMILPPR